MWSAAGSVISDADTTHWQKSCKAFGTDDLRSHLTNLSSFSMVAWLGNLRWAPSHDSVFVNRVKIVFSVVICLARLERSLILFRGISFCTSLVRMLHWSSIDKARKGARCCCLNSCFDTNCFTFSFWSFKLPISNISITFTARSHTGLAKVAWCRMESWWVLEIICRIYMTKKNTCSHISVYIIAEVVLSKCISTMDINIMSNTPSSQVYVYM